MCHEAIIWRYVFENMQFSMKCRCIIKTMQLDVFLETAVQVFDVEIDQQRYKNVKTNKKLIHIHQFNYKI